MSAIRHSTCTAMLLKLQLDPAVARHAVPSYGIVRLSDQTSGRVGFRPSCPFYGLSNLSRGPAEANDRAASAIAVGDAAPAGSADCVCAAGGGSLAVLT